MRDLRQGKKLVNDQSLQRCTIRHRDVDEVVLMVLLQSWAESSEDPVFIL